MILPTGSSRNFGFSSSRLRRVNDPAQTPLDRVRASGASDPERLAQLEHHRASLDPFELARRIEQKLEVIYELAYQRLSPSQVLLHSSSPRAATRKPYRCSVTL
jgi:hypothetical protein